MVDNAPAGPLRLPTLLQAMSAQLVDVAGRRIEVLVADRRAPDGPGRGGTDVPLRASRTVRAAWDREIEGSRVRRARVRHRPEPLPIGIQRHLFARWREAH